jgi:hypothetical protein
MTSIDPTHLYYNIDVCNIDNNNNGTYQLLAKPTNYIENRANSFLEYPEDYDLSVMSFNIDNNYLPIQIVQPVLGSTFSAVDGYPSIYALSVSFNGSNSGGLSVNWKPSDPTLKLDTTITKNELTNEYFWNYNINYFLELLNNTINKGILAVAPTETLFPFFYYDSSISRITFSAPASWITDINGINTGYTLNINGALYSLLGGFNYIYQTFGYPQGYYSLVVIDTFTNRYNQQSTFSSTPTNPYVIITQSFNTIQNWNPVSSIVFLSPTVPVVNELIAKPLIYGSNPNNGTEGDVLNVLFDYQISIRDNPETTFQPTGQYALTSLFGKHPISELQVITVWKDTFGNLHPLKLEYGSSFEMKILFRKKEFRKKIQ